MVDVAQVDAADLWGRLPLVPDRRGRQGRQYGLPAVVTLTLAAILSGANDLRVVFRWGRRLPPGALAVLGLDQATCHAMYHYFYEALDVAAVEAALGEWVRGSGPAGHVALHGKRLRGSAPAGHDGSAGVHLVLAFASRLGGVIGQLQVAPKGIEITAAFAAQGSAAAARRRHRRRSVLPARDPPACPRPAGRLPVSGQNQPAVLDG